MRAQVALAILTAGLMGCARDAGRPDPEQDPAQQRRATLDRIAAECGLPPATFSVVAADDIRFRPAPDSQYESVECAVRMLRESDIPIGSVGFVGNEAFQPEASNASSH